MPSCSFVSSLTRLLYILRGYADQSVSSTSLHIARFRQNPDRRVQYYRVRSMNSERHERRTVQTASLSEHRACVWMSQKARCDYPPEHRIKSHQPSIDNGVGCRFQNSRRIRLGGTIPVRIEFHAQSGYDLKS